MHARTSKRWRGNPLLREPLVVNRLPHLGIRGGYRHGQDLPEIRDWDWRTPKAVAPRTSIVKPAA